MSTKKTYEKPKIKKVELTREDAVLTACKKGPHMNGPQTNLSCNQAVCSKSANS